jgi:hypothetical protein
MSGCPISSHLRCAVLATIGCLSALPSLVRASRQPASAVSPARSTVSGVTQLAHRSDAFTRAPQMTLERSPLTVFGGAKAPDFDLTYAYDVALLADGRLVTLSRVGSRLFMFSPSGNGERPLGRTGKGPGELTRPTGLASARGDTIVAPDGANLQLNWITAKQGFVRSKPLPRFPGSSHARPAGMLRGGELVFSNSGLVQDASPTGITRPTSSVVVLSADASRARVVASIPDLEVVEIETRMRGRLGRDSRPRHFTRVAEVHAWDTVIATGSGEGYRIDLRDAAGRIRTTLQVPVVRRVVTKAMRDSMIATRLRRFDDVRSEGMVDEAESKRLERAAPFVDSLPPYGSWFVAPNQTLWVLDYFAPGDVMQAATGFRQDGAIVGRLTWRGTGIPVAFGNDRVVLRELDDDGVASFAMYRIQPPAR